MFTLTDRLYAQARITPIQPQNRVRSVKKLNGGSLEVTLCSGHTYTLDSSDAEFQAFVVWTVLNPNT